MSNGINGHSAARPRSEKESATKTPGAMLTPNSFEDAQILAAMDKLRELGVDRKYPLPQIIVCGSQSAGKSSVLESLVQVPFPRGEKTCTRYVTKVTILPAATIAVEVRIQPSLDRPPAEAATLVDFYRKDDSGDYAANLARFMDEAHRLIIPGPSRTTANRDQPMIAKDILLITVYGPDTRPLQVLDLPGLITFDQQAQGNERVIESMVTRYMAEKQSIILAVIKATEDLNNQQVLKLCKSCDPEGKRTLGIITRPDVAETAQRRNLIAVMQGRDKDFKFHHRWHILRNRSADEANVSQEARDNTEKTLLDGPLWNVIDRSCRGISELRERLRELLFGVAKRELPWLRRTFREKLGQLLDEFEALGGKELAPEQLAKAMQQCLSRLRDASRDHARAVYESDIRNSPYNSAVYLRSRVAKRSALFREKLFATGHAWTTLIRPEPQDPGSSDNYSRDPESGSPDDDDAELGPAEAKIRVPTSLQAEIDEVAQMLEQTQGQTLPGTFDPRRIANLYWRMSEGWDAIAREHVEQIYRCCRLYFRDITVVAFQRGPGPRSLGFSNAQEVAQRFVGPHIVPRLDKCRENALEELAKLDEDRRDAPINADRRFLDDWLSFREEREFIRAMKARHAQDAAAAGGIAGAGVAGGVQTPPADLDKTTYARRAGLHSQREWTEATAREYLRAMWSHYCVRLPSL